MRILHLVGKSSPDPISIALAAEQSPWLEPVVMACEGSEAAEQAISAGLPIVFLRPGQTSSSLSAAMDVLTPDLVHLHGALASDAAVPLRIFSHRPIVLHLQSEDFGADRRVLRLVRGMRLDWRGGHRVAAICPETSLLPERSALPIGVSEIITVRPTDVTVPWCAALYRRLLHVEAQTAHNLPATGIA